MERIFISGGTGALLVLALMASSVEWAQAAEQQEENEMSSESSESGRKQLDFEAEPEQRVDGQYDGRVIGCLGPALRATGIDWSMEYLRGFFGIAFAFSMNEDGGILQQADNYEWHHFFGMLEFLNVTGVDENLKDELPAEERVAIQARAWDLVRRAIDEGYPVLAWQVMTVEMKDSRVHPLPGLWSLIVGYDEEAGTYTVSHSGYGTYTIGWDAFGYADPVHWFHVSIFRPLTEPFDAQAASRRAIEHAVEASQGKYPGAHAPAHGLAAWDMWLEAFRHGTVSADAVPHHADFLVRARSSAATYLRQIESHLPANASSPLRDAANSYEQVAARSAELRDLYSGEDPDVERGAKLLASALAEERAALASLQQVLEAR